ncbi:substrate-binding domain-containing protein [Dolosigranulum pigrum]|uniref:substrate-binding domain-containing protein n=1 Tax=Dolosigranulum pigrum TaxID=29394 RepID=UPI003CC73D56
MSFGEYTSPGLTTVAQPAEKIGKSAAEMLIKIIENKNIVSQNIKLKPKLIKRESIRE